VAIPATVTQGPPINHTVPVRTDADRQQS